MCVYQCSYRELWRLKQRLHVKLVQRLVVLFNVAKRSSLHGVRISSLPFQFIDDQYSDCIGFY